MPPTPLVVGVAGGSAAGKTTVVRRLQARLDDGPVSLLEQDRYYRNQSDLVLDARETINFDHPDAIDFDLLTDHLRALREGRPVDAPRYDFTLHARETKADRIKAGATIIVEGILVLADAGLRDLLDIKVFVDADDRTRFRRRLERDVADRGRSPESVTTQYETTVRPMHGRYVEPSRQYADLVLSGTHAGSAELEVLVDLVSRPRQRRSG